MTPVLKAITSQQGPSAAHGGSSTRRARTDPARNQALGTACGLITPSECIHLENSTIEMCNAFNTPRLAPLFKQHLHPTNFTGIAEPWGGVCTATPEEQAVISTELGQENRRWRNQAYNVTSYADQGNGTVTVLISATLSGYCETLACDAAHEMKWRRSGEGWRAVEYRFISGAGQPATTA